MIYIPQHSGSGWGDQLFCYLAGRITAERLGVPFALFGESKWKSTIKADMGYTNVRTPFHVEMPAGKVVIEKDWPIYEGKTYYDPEFNFIEDNTIVDGCRCQDERYWEGYPIGDWLQSEPIHVPEDTCIINFRGGEFTRVPELFLPKSYWDEAIKVMIEQGFTKFEVHTDDTATARQFFPDFPSVHDVGVNWRSVRSAKGAIIANSAFGIIPRLLAHYEDEMADDGVVTVAPRGWARYKSRDWSTPQNYYKDFIYV